MFFSEFIYYRLFKAALEAEEEILPVRYGRGEYCDGVRPVCAEDVRKYLVAYDGNLCRSNGKFRARGADSLC